MKRKEYYSAQYQVEHRQRPGRSGTRPFLFYRGPYFRYDVPLGQLWRVKLLYVAAALSTGALLLLQGFILPIELERIYVLLPYIIAFLPWLYLVYDTGIFFTLPVNMTEQQYDAAVVRHHRCLLAIGLLQAFCAVGQTVGHLVQHTLFFLELPTWLCEVGCAAAGLCAWRALRGIEVIKMQPLDAQKKKDN